MNIQQIQALFINPLEYKSLKSISKQEVNISEFMEVLAEEIEYILCQIISIEKNCTFLVKNFEVWSIRLLCRCILWLCFKKFNNSVCISKEYQNIFKNNTFLPYIVNILLNDIF